MPNESTSGKIGDLRVSILLFISALLVYNINFREISGKDTIPTRFLPISIIEEFDLDLDEYPFLRTSDPNMPYHLQKVRGHDMSSYPVLPAILAVPIYLPSVKHLWPWKRFWIVRGGGGTDFFHDVSILSKFAASVLTALSIPILFLAFRRLTDRSRAIAFSVICAFATLTWPVSSQGLWQHGPAQLFLALTLYLLARGMNGGWSNAWAGLALGLAIDCRLNLALVAIAVFFYLLHKHRKTAIAYCALTAAALIPLLAYNFYYFGTLTGGYTKINEIHPTIGPIENLWATPLYVGLLGLLISPSRGLFVYSPFTIFSFLGLFCVWKKGVPALFKYLAIGAIAMVCLSAKHFAWWGGWSYGPRYLVDISSLLCLLLIPAERLIYRHRATAYTFAALVILSIFVQAVGAFNYPGGWNFSATRTNVDLDQTRLWDWEDPQILCCFNSGPRSSFWVQKARSHERYASRLVTTCERLDAFIASLPTAFSIQLIPFRLAVDMCAEREAKRAIELCPQWAQPHHLLGNIYFRRKLYREAGIKYLQSINLDSGFPEAWLNLGNVFFYQKDFRRASENYQRAALLFPSKSKGRAQALKSLGDSYLNSNELNVAIESYEQAVRVMPRMLSAWRSLALAHAMAGDKDEAAKACHSILSVNPNDAVAKQILSRLKDGGKR